MNVNESLAIAKCKNGFFVHSNEYGCFSDAISDGVVFQSFYELLQFLNSHFPSEENVMPEDYRLGNIDVEPIVKKQPQQQIDESFLEDPRLHESMLYDLGLK